MLGKDGGRCCPGLLPKTAVKILAISTWNPFPPDNGSKIRAYHLLKALSQFHDVTLISFDPGGAGGTGAGVPDWLQGYFPVRVDPFYYTNLPQVVKYISPVPLAFWPHPAMSKNGARLAKAGHWDAVVAIQMPVARYALFLSHGPRILDVDTALSYQIYERYRAEKAFLGRLRAQLSHQKARRYEARMLERYQVGTVASSLEKDFVSQLTYTRPTRVEVVPNGVDCQYYQWCQGATQPTHLVYNGALTYSVNYDAMSFFLSAIFPLIKAQSANVSLTITGTTTGVDLSALPLNGSVRLSGYVDDIRPLFTEASICVVPLREGGGTRLKILEAMALGTPVVSTTKGAEGLEVVDGEHLLLADDAHFFAQRTLELMRNAELRRRLTENARRLVEQKYDWEEIGQRFVSLVEDVVREKRGQSYTGD